MIRRRHVDRRGSDQRVAAVLDVSGLLTLLSALAVVLPAAAGAAGARTPIPGGGATVLPIVVGHAAQPVPVLAPVIPQNPFMAANPFNNIHDDAWMSDTYRIAGPLGRSSLVLSSTLAPANKGTSPVFLCGAVAFDGHRRLVTVCIGGSYSRVVLVDPVSLQALAWFDLPPTGLNIKSALGGAYFYLDNHDRVVASTTTKHIWLVAETGPAASPSFKRVADYDLSRPVGEDKFIAVLPDWSGRIWYVTLKGIVGVLNPKTGRVRGVRLHEGIVNSFAATRTGVSTSQQTARCIGLPRPLTASRGSCGRHRTATSGRPSPASSRLARALHRRSSAAASTSRSPTMPHRCTSSYTGRQRA